MCRRRSPKVHSWPHLQSSIKGLDRRQIRQSRAFTRGDTDPQPLPRDATPMQCRPLSSCPCCLSGAWSRFPGLFPRSRQQGTGLCVRISDVGHRLTATPWAHRPTKWYSLFSKSQKTHLNLFTLFFLSLLLSCCLNFLLTTNYIFSIFFSFPHKTED